MVAVFRYGVIAELAERDDFAPGQMSRLVEEIAGRTHHMPGKGPLKVSERTIYAWLKSYREGGMEALRPRLRTDLGQSRVMDEATIARAIRLRKENPDRWTSTLLDIMKREGTFDGRTVPHRATVDRHLAAKGASRRSLRVLGTKRHIKMKFERFGHLWVGDYHHGPLVLGTDGKPTTAKISAFLDHTTRYPVADRYYLAEDIATLRDCLLRALLKWGKAKLVYVDRGAAYRAEQLKYSLDHIGVKLVHSKEYYSEGRGLIEKWWQVTGQFESEVALREELCTLHELNRLWEAYRELRYCRKVHSELGKTPNEAISEVTPRPLDPQAVRELFLVKAMRKVHPKDCCVSVYHHKFLCESHLKRQQVEVRYDPNDFSSVLIFKNRKRVQRAFPQALNAPPEPQPEPEQVGQSVDYLALLREDYDRQLLQHARPLAYARLELTPGFDAERFVAVVCELAGLDPRPPVRRELASFWDTYGPLPEELVRIGTEHAIRLHGRTRHVRVYLHAIRTLVLAHWRHPPKEE